MLAGEMNERERVGDGAAFEHQGAALGWQTDSPSGSGSFPTGKREAEAGWDAAQTQPTHRGDCQARPPPAPTHPPTPYPPTEKANRSMEGAFSQCPETTTQ